MGFVIENDRIAEVASAGYPLSEAREHRCPEAGGREIDGEGMFGPPFPGPPQAPIPVAAMGDLGLASDGPSSEHAPRAASADPTAGP